MHFFNVALVEKCIAFPRVQLLTTAFCAYFCICIFAGFFFYV